MASTKPPQVGTVGSILAGNLHLTTIATFGNVITAPPLTSTCYAVNTVTTIASPTSWCGPSAASAVRNGRSYRRRSGRSIPAGCAKATFAQPRIAPERRRASPSKCPIFQPTEPNRRSPGHTSHAPRPSCQLPFRQLQSAKGCPFHWCIPPVSQVYGRRR